MSETKNITKEEFETRFKAATQGRELNEVAREINNEFEQYRTSEVMQRVQLMASGDLTDVDMLEAIERLPALEVNSTEETTDNSTEEKIDESTGASEASETNTEETEESVTAKAQADFNERFAKATEGKNLEELANQFCEKQKPVIANYLKEIAKGDIIDNDMLSFLENN